MSNIKSNLINDIKGKQWVHLVAANEFFNISLKTTNKNGQSWELYMRNGTIDNGPGELTVKKNFIDQTEAKQYFKNKIKKHIEKGYDIKESSDDFDNIECASNNKSAQKSLVKKFANNLHKSPVVFMNNLTTESNEQSKKKRGKVVQESSNLEKRKLSFDNSEAGSLRSSDIKTSGIKAKSQSKKKQLKQDTYKSNTKSNLKANKVSENADESKNPRKACNETALGNPNLTISSLIDNSQMDLVDKLMEKEKEISLRSLSPMVSFHNLDSRENSVNNDEIDNELSIETQVQISDTKSQDAKSRKKFKQTESLLRNNVIEDLTISLYPNAKNLSLMQNLEESVTVSGTEECREEKAISLTVSKSSKKNRTPKSILKSNQQKTPSKSVVENQPKISNIELSESLNESNNKSKLNTPSIVSGSKKSFKTPNSISKKPRSQKQSTVSNKKIRCSSALINSGKISNNLSNVFEENAAEENQDCDLINLNVSASKNDDNEINIEISVDDAIEGKMNVAYFSDKSKERLSIYVDGKEVGNIENMNYEKEVQEKTFIDSKDSTSTLNLETDQLVLNRQESNLDSKTRSKTISPEKSLSKNNSEIVEFNMVDSNLVLNKIESENACDNTVHNNVLKIVHNTTLISEQPQNNQENVELPNEVLDQAEIKDIIQETIENALVQQESDEKAISKEVSQKSAKESVQKSVDSNIIQETQEEALIETQVNQELDLEKDEEVIDFNQQNIIDNEDFLFNKIADDAKSFEEEVCNTSKNSLSEKLDNFDQKNDSILGEVDQLYEQNHQIEDVINNLDNQSEISKVSNEIIENMSEKECPVENALVQENVIETRQSVSNHSIDQKSISHHSMDQEVLKAPSKDDLDNSSEMQQENLSAEKHLETTSDVQSTLNQNESSSNQNEINQPEVKGILTVNEEIMKSRNITPTKIDGLKSDIKKSMTKENSITKLNMGSRNASIMQSCSKVRDENNNICGNEVTYENFEENTSNIENELCQSENQKSSQKKASIEKEVFEEQATVEVIEPIIENTLFEEDTMMDESVLKNIFEQHSHSHPFFNDQIKKENSIVEQDISANEINESDLELNAETRSVDKNSKLQNVDKSILQQFEIESILNKNTYLSDSEKLSRKKKYLQVYYPEKYEEFIKNDPMELSNAGNKKGFQAPIFPLGHPCEFSGLLLANKWDKKLDVTGWLMSEKYDGVRCFWNGNELYSRSGSIIKTPKFFTRNFPRSPLDGELHLGRNNYEECAQIIANGEKDHSGWLQMSFIVLDAPAMNLLFRQRLSMLERVFTEGNNPTFMKLNKHRCVKDNSHVMEELARIESIGGEGVMLKNPSSLYEGRRTWAMLKVKSYLDEEAQILRKVFFKMNKPTEKRRVKALIMKKENGIEFRLRNGLNSEKNKNSFEIGNTVTYKFKGYDQQNIPKFPVYQRMRAEY